MRKLFFALAIMGAAFWTAPAEAVPQSSGLVVTTCGTLGTPYIAGRDGPLTVNTAGQNCINGSISATNPSVGTNGAAAPSSSTQIGALSAGNLVPLVSTNGTALDINCTVGCAGGSSSNAASGVATSSTNGATNAWNYGFNGTTWDQLQVDGSKNLKVIINAALPAGTNVLGHVIADTGSTTAVTGTVSVNPGTAANWGIAATGAAVPANAVYLGANKSGNLVAPILDASSFLEVNCATGCSGTTAVDATTFTPGVTNTGTAGGFFQTTPTNNALTNLQQGMVQMSANRAFFVTENASLPTSVTLQSAAVASGNGTTLNTNGMASAILTVNCATCSGGTTVNFEGSEDNTNYSSIVAVQLGTSTLATSTTTAGLTEWSMPVAGFQVIRARISAYSAGTVTVTGHTVPVTYASPVVNASIVGTVPTNVAQINGVTPLMGNGVTGTGSPRITIASDSSGIITTGTAGSASAQVITVQGIASMTKLLVTPDSVALPANQSVNISQINAVTPLMGNGVTGTGSLRVTIASDNTANSNPFLVTQVPSATTAGTTLFTLTLANTTNATNVKAGAGNLYSISGFNMSSATPVWISLYNNVGTPTCGSSIIQQFLIPGNTTGSGFVYDFANPKAFSTGIAFCATTGIAGTGAPAATTYVVNIDYK